MAEELNPKELLAKRQEESRRKMKKEGLDEPPVDPERVKQVEAFLADPVKYLKRCFIDSQYMKRDVELLQLILLAKILEKIH